MEKEWPPLKSCIQYRQGMLPPFLQKFDWEDDEDDLTQYGSVENSDDEDGPPREFKFKFSTLKKFVHQVRTTRGYGVDTSVPMFMCSPFLWVEEHYTGDVSYEKLVNLAIEIVIEHINSKTGKFYKHVNILKVVASRHNIMLLTFTAVEGRFTKRKREDPEEWQNKLAPEQTFLAAVTSYSPVRQDIRVLECFLKPEGPAPWDYEELPEFHCGM